MARIEFEDSVEERAVSYQPPFLPPMPIDLTDEEENSDFSGSEDGQETGNDSDTEETSDENGSESPNPSKCSDKALSENDKEKPEPENRFLTSLMKAAQSYSDRLRISGVSKPASSTSQLPPLDTPSTSNILELADDDETQAEQFSDDEDCNDAFLPSLSVEESKMLFYKPVGKWADLGECPIEDPVIIAYLHSGAMCDASIKQGTLGGRRITYISKTWTFCHEWEGFFSEMMLYADPSYLRPLQGKVIPEIIGLYLVDGAISVAMELPSSTFWVEASEDMSDHLKRKCIAAFDKIHAQGVLHNDVELRHMLINSTGEVTIIDFQMSRALKPKYEVGLQRATKDEIRIENRKIRFKLDYNYAQRRENIKRTRVMTRRMRNLERKQRRKLLPPGSEISPEDEYEKDDEDDIINPIVGDAEWTDLWLGDEFESSCYVVPGQDALKVEAMLKGFARKEIDRQEDEEDKKEKEMLAYQARMRQSTEVADHHSADTPSSHSPSSDSRRLDPTASHVSPPSEPEGGDLDADTPSGPVPDHQPVCVSSTTPRGIKRPRDFAEDDETLSRNDGCTNAVDSELRPTTKRRLTEADATTLERDKLAASVRPEDESVDSASEATSIPLQAAQVPTEAPDSLPLKHPSPPPSTSASLPHIYPFIEERKSIAVPYNDYTGPVSIKKLRNVLPESQVSEWRRSWIRQDNVRRFREEGAVHPYDELFQDLLKQMDTDSDGADDESTKPMEGKRKRKWKGTVQRGSIKRFKREMEAPGKRRFYALLRKEQYFKDKAAELGWSVDDDDDAFSDSGDEEDRRMALLFGPEEKQEAEDESIREGPRILTFAELETRNTELANGHLGSCAATPAFSLGSGSSGGFAGPSRTKKNPTTAPRNSILRRQLTTEDMLKQRAFEETLLILGQHPNQLNLIDEEDTSTTPRAPASQSSEVMSRPTLVHRASNKDVTPLLKPYTEASEVASPPEKKHARLARYPPGYSTSDPPSQMFMPRPASSLTGRLSSLPLRRKRPLRTGPAVSVCYFTGEIAPFPPPAFFPVQSERGSGSTRAFTIPYSSSPPSMTTQFPAPSIPTGTSKRPSSSVLAQARSLSGKASGSNVTLEDLYDGSHTPNISNAPEPVSPVQGPLSVPPHRRTPRSNPRYSTHRERDLIGAELAPGPGGHATEDTEMQDETESVDNTELEAERGGQGDASDTSGAAGGNTSLSAHLQAFAKAVLPWFDRR